MPIRAPGLATCLLMSTVAFGQWQADGQEAPDTPWQKHVRGFGVQLLITDEPEAFFKEWEQPDPQYKPTISTTETAHRGSKVVALVIFGGCHQNAKGFCDAEVDFKLLRPDGTVYGEHKKAEVWKGKPVPPNNNLQLSVGNLAFRGEPDDPLGKYRLEATVRDKVASIEIPLVQEIEVLPTE